MEGGRGLGFPVVFFDGEREKAIGDVKINPAMEYKPFQLMLSKKIGLSPNQISIYLVNRKRDHRTPFSKDRRRIPITGKFNFGSICRQNQCCILVVLKKSRKSRSRREPMINSAEFSDENEFSHDQIAQSELDYLNGRLKSLRVKRENYQMAMAKGDATNPPYFSSGRVVDPNQNVDSFPATDDGSRVNSTRLVMKKKETNKAFCEECWDAKKNGGTMSFHPCVNDAVATQFNTRLGPINRPNKSLA